MKLFPKTGFLSIETLIAMLVLQIFPDRGVRLISYVNAV